MCTHIGHLAIKNFCYDILLQGPASQHLLVNVVQHVSLYTSFKVIALESSPHHITHFEEYTHRQVFKIVA
jgi:hypothetical protein